MRQIVCEDCGKRYDFEKDDFCPKCGAFNQPVKTWGTDAQGNVIRVDGVNERDHAQSFVHSEVHKEKRVRQAQGLDQSPKPKSARQQPPPVRQAAPARQAPQSQAKKKGSGPITGVKLVFCVIAAIVLINFFFSLLTVLMNLF